MLRRLLDVAAAKIVCWMIGHDWSKTPWCSRCGDLPPPTHAFWDD